MGNGVVSDDWNAVFSRPLSVLSDDELLKLHERLQCIEIDQLPEHQYRDFLELMRLVLVRGEIKMNSTTDKHSDWMKHKLNANDLQSAANDNKQSIDEAYYIQKIQDLNRELAEYTYNRVPTEMGDGDSSIMHPMGIDTKKDLLFKIHTKNKYIKRLLCENDALRQQIDQLNEKNMQLDICLRQTTNRLTKTNSDLMELKRQNTISADDIVVLNAKIRDISQQMCKMEKEKLKYQTDILLLGQEIHRRMDRWGEVLQTKRQRSSPAESNVPSEQFEPKERRTMTAKSVQGSTEHNRLEVTVLSQAVNKRNAIIAELELLLTDLTMEVAHSADVINNLTKNFVVRENNFAENLEKLQGHLSALLQKQKPSSPDKHMETVSAAPSPTPIEPQPQKPKVKRRSRKHKERTL